MARSAWRKGLFLLALVVVLAGCSGFVPGESDEREIPEGLGEVDGVEHDDEIDIDPEDGLTEEELDQLVKRTMARVEVVRELEFERIVDSEIITREEYQERRGSRSVGETRAAWENQIWEALFIVGQDEDATEVVNEAFGDAVLGYYEPGQNRIVLVSGSDSPTVNKHTLIHELTHALQEQQFGLEFGHDTRDEQAAYDTVIEGEAELVPQLYLEEWCEQWDCIRPEAESETGDPVDIRQGIAMVIGQPYAQGLQFVSGVKESGGWEAVNELHEEPPRSTAETTYPDRAAEPVNVTVPDSSSRSWERFDHHPVGDTLGVASLYAMFAANGIVENTDPANYADPAVEGWIGDQIVPYRSDDGTGYVWELAWEDDSEAEQFADAYGDLLDEHGGLARGTTEYVIQDGPFAGAYRVTVEGDRVRILNGPDLDALDEIHGN